jgi:type IV pilus assembly protein PilA
MLLQNIRAKIAARLNGEGEAGFTLIELLVVMLILGILAAIAIPAFFNQASKASDANAKETLHTAQITMASCVNENKEEFSVCTQKKLHEIESTVPETAGESLTATPESEGYKLVADGSGSNEWEIVYTKTGGLEYLCTAEGNGCTNGSWSNE